MWALEGDRELMFVLSALHPFDGRICVDDGGTFPNFPNLIRNTSGDLLVIKFVPREVTDPPQSGRHQLNCKSELALQQGRHDYVAGVSVLEPCGRILNRSRLQLESRVAQASLPKLKTTPEVSSPWQGLMGRTGSDRDRPLDTQVHIVTPENIEFSYHVAGPMARSLAFALDLLFYFLVYILAAVVLGLLFAFVIAPTLTYFNLTWLLTELGFISQGLYMVGLFLGYWFYWGISEAKFNGKTLGKLILGMRVVSGTGHPIGGWQAMSRTFVRATEVLPLAPGLLFSAMFWGESAVYGWDGEPVTVVFFIPTFLVAIICMTCSPRFQRIGDLVSGTMVVYEHRGWMPGLAYLEDERTPRLAELIPPGFKISRELARALASYVHKRRYLTPLRRRDIARHLAEPLLGRFGLQEDTSYDLFLCALYYRAFVAQGALAESSLMSTGAESELTTQVAGESEVLG